MSRPLLVSDCDEVLLHMVTHFADWLDEDHGVRFDLDTGRFENAFTRAASGELLESAEVWALLGQFFREQMHRQTLVPGALEALGRIGEEADIVILTNLGDEAHPFRVEQLASHGIRHQVICNRGGKGEPVRRILEARNAGQAVFVDDLAVHHESVAAHAPAVWRLHMIAEPRVARAVPPAPHAHARIDRWNEAGDWILEKLREKA